MGRRERYEAEQRASIQRVMMQFVFNHSAKLWRVTFRPHGDNVPMPRVLHFADPDKLRELFRRFGSRQMAEDHAALEFAIRTKRGAVELLLAEQQLKTLRIRKPPTVRADPR